MKFFRTAEKNVILSEVIKMHRTVMVWAPEKLKLSFNTSYTCKHLVTSTITVHIGHLFETPLKLHDDAGVAL